MQTKRRAGWTGYLIQRCFLLVDKATFEVDVVYLVFSLADISRLELADLDSQPAGEDLYMSLRPWTSGLKRALKRGGSLDLLMTRT